MIITFDVDLEKFRYSLIGDGYTLKKCPSYVKRKAY